jgi:hypothetical protein
MDSESRCNVHLELARAFSKRGGKSLGAIERELSEFCRGMEQIGLVEPTLRPSAVAVQVACFGVYSLPSMTNQSLGSGGRRRPSPRGNSGPG